jgi:CarD family transcriptional regulator
MSILILGLFLKGVEDMLNIGDKIVYPMHGAGVIESIEEKEVLGEKKKYYIMRLPIDDMKVMIPIDSINDFGIRSTIGYNEFNSVMEVFSQEDNNISDNWGRRYRCNMEKIKKGSIYGVAEVVKDLIIRDWKKGLSPGEKKILENAEQILYSELILVTGMGLDEIRVMVRDTALGRTR